ncbi:MAG: hypothetical protein ACLVH3_16850 [Blautia obeum]
MADAGTPEEEILTHLAEVYGLGRKDTATLQDALMAVAREMVSRQSGGIPGWIGICCRRILIWKIWMR